jgi:hypothetical protein
MMRRWCVASLLACVTAMCATAQDAAPLPPERKVALRTTAGYYLTAENGGGSSVQTDRMELGPWETFTMVPVGPGVFAFRSENGSYLLRLERDAAQRPGRTDIACRIPQTDRCFDAVQGNAAQCRRPGGRHCDHGRQVSDSREQWRREGQGVTRHLNR